MRFVPFAVVLTGCASVPMTAPARATETKPAETTPDVESFWSKRPTEPPEPPLVSLATRHTYFILATDAGVTTCRAWAVEQARDRDSDLAFLRDGDESIGFASHGAQLALRSHALTGRRETSSRTCSRTFSVRELDNGDLDVSGSRWFGSEADCAAALAKKERVAMDWSDCALDPDATLQQQAASQRAFEAMLRDGGTAFTLAGTRCMPLHATPARITRTLFEGELWTRLPDGRTGYGYQLEPNAMEIVLLGPHSSTTDSGSFGMPCGDEQSLVYGNDTVEIGETVYLSLASCRAARSKERARQARLPTPADVELGAMRAPSLGGC